MIVIDVLWYTVGLQPSIKFHKIVKGHNNLKTNLAKLLTLSHPTETACCTTWRYESFQVVYSLYICPWHHYIAIDLLLCMPIPNQNTNPNFPSRKQASNQTPISMHKLHDQYLMKRWWPPLFSPTHDDIIAIFWLWNDLDWNKSIPPIPTVYANKLLKTAFLSEFLTPTYLYTVICTTSVICMWQNICIIKHNEYF